MSAVAMDLMAMKVDELKEELEARDARRDQAARRCCAGGCTRQSCVSFWRVPWQTADEEA